MEKYNVFGKKVIVSFTCQPHKGSGDDKDPLPLPPAAASDVVIQDVVKVLFQRSHNLFCVLTPFLRLKTFSTENFASYNVLI